MYRCMILIGRGGLLRLECSNQLMEQVIVITGPATGWAPCEDPYPVMLTLSDGRVSYEMLIYRQSGVMVASADILVQLQLI
jgi:hypothetical protein